MEAHRLRAPSADGSILAEPPLAEAAGLLSRNRGRFGAWDYDFQGRSAGRLRRLARTEILGRAADYLRRMGLDLPPVGPADAPWLVTGHQPELFHPGVWIKNFALAGLARQTGGLALNLIVDNDLPKAASIPRPGRGFRPASTYGRRRSISTIGPSIIPMKTGRSATRPASPTSPPASERPSARAWPTRSSIRSGRSSGRSPGRRTGSAAGSRRLGGPWRLAGASRTGRSRSAPVCESDSFLWFLSHLLAFLPRFQGVHNAALARYRAALRHPERESSRPRRLQAAKGTGSKPRSGSGGRPSRGGAPCWPGRRARRSNCGSPARRIRSSRSRSDRTVRACLCRRSPPRASRPSHPPADSGSADDHDVRPPPPRRPVPPRDRRGQVRRTGRRDPPPVLPVRAAALPDALADAVGRPAARPGLARGPAVGRPAAPPRPCRFNPDRHLAEGTTGSIADLVESKRQAIAGPVETRRQRVARFHEIRRINEELRALVAAERSRLEEERSGLIPALKRNAVARSREYSFVLHSESRLRQSFDRGPTRPPAAPAHDPAKVSAR